MSMTTKINQLLSCTTTRHKLSYHLAHLALERLMTGSRTSSLAEHSLWWSTAGFSSDCQPVFSGVSQGSVSGLCLFLFYINDIAQDLNSTTWLFADDTMILLAIKNDDDTHLLQQDLDTLAHWDRINLVYGIPPKQMWSDYHQRENKSHHASVLPSWQRTGTCWCHQVPGSVDLEGPSLGQPHWSNHCQSQ